MVDDLSQAGGVDSVAAAPPVEEILVGKGIFLPLAVLQYYTASGTSSSLS